MEAIKIPKTLKFYQLVKMTTNAGLTFSLVGFSNGISVGVGFFKTLEEAEFNRTLEALKNSDASSYHIFELEFPNPVYQE